MKDLKEYKDPPLNLLLGIDILEKAERIKDKTKDIHNLLLRLSEMSQAEVHESTIELERSAPKREKRKAYRKSDKGSLERG